MTDKVETIYWPDDLDYKYCATDANGLRYFYKLKPRIGSIAWVPADDSDFPILDTLDGISECKDWEESLVIRKEWEFHKYKRHQDTKLRNQYKMAALTGLLANPSIKLAYLGLGHVRMPDIEDACSEMANTMMLGETNND